MISIKTGLKNRAALVIGLSAVVLSTAAIALVRPDMSPGMAAAVASEPASAITVPSTEAIEREQAASPAQTVATTDRSDCGSEHWPYYSEACLKGSHAPEIRVLSMAAAVEPASLSATAPVPVATTTRDVDQKSTRGGVRVSQTAGAHRHKASRRYVQRMRMQPPEVVYQASIDSSW